jgi:hypothetical protein
MWNAQGTGDGDGESLVVELWEKVASGTGPVAPGISIVRNAAMSMAFKLTARLL